MAGRLIQARESAKMKPAAVGRALGLSRQAVYKWETGVNEPATETLTKVAELYGVNMDWLATGRGEPRGAFTHSSLTQSTSLPEDGVIYDAPLPNRASMRKDVPVLGVVVGGTNADFTVNGEVIDFVRRPPGLLMAKEAYAVYVTGESMSPRYERGDLVYVDPRRPARNGDDVVIQMAAEEDGSPAACFIKRLVRMDADTVICRQFNPADDLSLDARRVAAIHRISRWSDLLDM